MESLINAIISWLPIIFLCGIVTTVTIVVGGIISKNIVSSKEELICMTKEKFEEYQTIAYQSGFLKHAGYIKSSNEKYFEELKELLN